MYYYNGTLILHTYSSEENHYNDTEYKLQRAYAPNTKIDKLEKT